jgi:pentatricopeptide repeat protein
MGMYREMVAVGHRVSTAMVEALVRPGKLDAGMELWEEMRRGGLRPSFGLYTMVVEANARSGRLDMARWPPSCLATYACLVEMRASNLLRLSASNLLQPPATEHTLLAVAALTSAGPAR